MIGQAALWVVVVTALVSAADYFRRFNLFSRRASKSAQSRKSQRSSRTQPRSLRFARPCSRPSARRRARA